MATEWYYAKNGEQIGPITSEQLKNFLKSGEILLNDLVWKDGLNDWLQVSKIPALAALCKSPQTTATSPQEVTVSPQKKTAATAVSNFQTSKSQTPNSVSSTSNSAVKPSVVWFYAQNGKQFGPVDSNKLKAMALDGTLSPDDLIWKDGMKDWLQAGNAPGLKFHKNFHSEKSVTEKSITEKSAAAQSVAQKIVALKPQDDEEDLKLAEDEPVRNLPIETKPQESKTSVSKSTQNVKTISAATLSAASSTNSASAAASSVSAQMSAATSTSEPDSLTDVNAIFDLANDPSFVSVPASAESRPNKGLMAASWDDKKSRKKRTKAAPNSDGELTDQERTNAELWGTVIASAIGCIVCLVLAFYWHYQATALKREGITVSGRVVDIRVGHGRRGKTRYYPIVRFTTQDGAPQQVEMEQSKQYEVGQDVEVIYRESNPKIAEIEGTNSYGSSVWICAIIAVVLFIIAVYKGIQAYNSGG